MAEQDWSKLWAGKSFHSSILSFGRVIYNNHFLSILSPYLSREKSFIEIGSGSGSVVISAANLCKRSVGIDISKAAVSIAQKYAAEKNSKAEFIVADCFKLPFKDSSFDVVWSQGVLQEISDPEKCLKEQLRIVKPNGVILATVPATMSYLWLWEQISKLPFLSFIWPWPPQLFFSKELAASIAEKVSKNYIISRRGILGELLLITLIK